MSEQNYAEDYAQKNTFWGNATKYAAGITKFPEDKKKNVSDANKNNTYLSKSKFFFYW